MALRITIDGTLVECDTPQEAAALLQAFKRMGGAVAQPVHNKMPSVPIVSVAAKPGQSQAGSNLFQLDNQQGAFKRSHRAIVDALKASYPHGLSSERLASQIGLTKRSLPIIMVGLQTYAKKRGLQFDELIVRSEAPIGSKGSVYTLTEKGLNELTG